ncbi:PBP1A family penicillin-binding protein [Candidatus Wolfebacteria bacterium]|nr:PBP1A family penicillin-binding protein [Candidatus Wolfebacteria bacterium]
MYKKPKFRQKKQSSNSWLKAILAASLIFAVIFIWGVFKFVELAKDLPNPQQFISSRQISQSSKIYDKTGETLLYEIYNQEKRTVVPFEEIPEFVKKATISVEDKNFYIHPAIDWRAMIRAMIINIAKGRVVQGGSTITQQLAKNAFLTPERTYERKIKELVMAFWIEKKYSKDEILSLYLNQVPYGANAYGIEAASQIYFGKSVKDINLAEAALLSALPKAPTYYSPWGTHTQELIQRKDYILGQMFELGFIDGEELERAKKFTFKFLDSNLGSIKAPHFVMMVKEYLVDKYGEDFVNKGGLKITTTLDYKMQQIAERVVSEGAKRNDELYKGKNASLVAQDAKTGEILALVGSADYFDKQNEGNFNVAAQGLRQPGSAFKPFAYVTSFEKGYSPDTMVFDLPTEFVPNNPNCPAIVNFSNESKECYHPQNFDNEFRGPISLRNALAQSINVPAVKMLYLAGLNDTLKTAQNMGITTLKDSSSYGLSLVLGGGEVKLIDLVNAYSVFSQNGLKHNQKIILKVEDANNQIIESSSDQIFKVLDPNHAKMINDILSDLDARRPLYHSSFNLTTFDETPDIEVALKTGTTNDYRDAWTIGYTPSLAVGVWAGNNRQEPMQKNAGSILAALPIWNAFMKEVLKNYPAETFEKPIDENTSIKKPMVNGDLTGPNNEIHEILYYVDKNNPMGNQLQDPNLDLQFQNWETPVKNWVQNLGRG